MPAKKRKTEPTEEGSSSSSRAQASGGPKWSDAEKLDIMRYLLSKSMPTLSKDDLEALARILPGRTESGIATVWQRYLRPEIIRTGNAAKLSKSE